MWNLLVAHIQSIEILEEHNEKTNLHFVYLTHSNFCELKIRNYICCWKHFIIWSVSSCYHSSDMPVVCKHFLKLNAHAIYVIAFNHFRVRVGHIVWKIGQTLASTYSWTLNIDIDQQGWAWVFNWKYCTTDPGIEWSDHEIEYFNLIECLNSLINHVQTSALPSPHNLEIFARRRLLKPVVKCPSRNWMSNIIWGANIFHPHMAIHDQTW